MFIGELFFNLSPIDQKKIVFDNFEGRGYGCNPKYIAEELLRQNVDCEMVWLVRDLNEPMPPKIRKVAYKSVQAVKERLTAKVWVANHRASKGVRKRKNQYYVQTWHGAFGVKKAEKDALNVLPPKYVRAAQYDSKITNLFLSSSKIQTWSYRNNYWYDGEILECGFPRDDLFYLKRDDADFKKSILHSLGIKEGVKTVLYAPTFRDDYGMEAFDLNFSNVVSSLEQKTGEEWVLLYRMHPSVIKKFQTSQYADISVDVTSYPDMQELMLVSDALITDYSSSMFEYMLLDRPVFIYANDVEKMFELGRIRELYYELPFSKATNNDEMVKSIKSFSQEEYSSKLEQFKKKYAPYESGHAAQEVVDRIKKVIGEK